jgi:hypothetical protein
MKLGTGAVLGQFTINTSGTISILQMRADASAIPYVFPQSIPSGYAFVLTSPSSFHYLI